MFDSTVILNARLPQRSGLYQIAIQAGEVTKIEPADQLLNQSLSQPLTQPLSQSLSTPPRTAIDVEGDWITLGAIDLQINGALGLAFPDLRPDSLGKLQSICELLWQQGVSGFCPTLVTTSLENFHGSLAAIRLFQQQQAYADKADSARVLGAHLEGPFLNRAKRGAHPAEFLQPLTRSAVETVIGKFADAISIVTLAPEEAVEGMEEGVGDDSVIPWLSAQGITVSLGHSLATAQQAKQAFDQGATMVTHAFNAMPGLHHREPGLLGAALSDSRVFCGFIADGQHICPTMLDLLLRVGRGSRDAQMGGLFLVSDALSPLGLPDGVYPWDSRQIEVTKGTARLADGTLSGTTLPLIEGAANLVRWGLCDAEEAIALVTAAPRRAIGLPALSVGSPAQLIRWSQDAQNQLVWQWLSL
ncbi:MAG: N-acetylglucosamine-6-phosphate deacetylase [Phormidesmis sp.]